MILAFLGLTPGNSFSQAPQIKFNLVSGTNGVLMGKINGMKEIARVSCGSLIKLFDVSFATMEAT
jgi:hypothetical protein